MKVLMISTDRKIFDESSAVRQRMIDYGELVDELHVIVFSKNKNKKLNFGNIFVYPTNSWNRWFYVFGAIRIGKKILKPDLITTQDAFECGLVGWRLARYFNAKLQLQIHTDFLSSYFKKESLLNSIRVLIAKFLIPRANCIRVVSKKIRNSLLSKFNLDNVSVLPIFVDVKKIQDEPIKASLKDKYSQFDFVILIASRLTKEKNIRIAIKAMKQITKKYSKTGLIIVGEGAQEKKLKQQVKRNKLQNNIVFEKWSNHLSSYYKTADLFLLTSNYEGYGLTIIEAASVGCKIISSDVGVAREVLEEENIFKHKDVIDLKEKIFRAIQGEIGFPNRNFLDNFPTKTEYLLAYKKHWEQCGSQ